MTGHGTASRYNYGCRCDECRVAKATDQLRGNRQRKAMLDAGLTDVPHGRASTYRNWGCRCGACTEANSRALREYRRRKASSSTEEAS